MTNSITCNVCHSSVHEFGIATVLYKYPVRYYLCSLCGLIQTETPYWLEQAYQSPIAASDIGLLSRNIKDAHLTERIVQRLFDAEGVFVDYGGGYGILTRLLRDAGLQWFRYDKYCPNLFAACFDASIDRKYELLTAFEVMEHIADPLNEMKMMTRLSRNILFSTMLLPETPPKLGDWWYYCLETGQHVTFYTKKALQLLAESAGLQLHTHENIHLFTDRQIRSADFEASVWNLRKYWVFSELLDPPVRRPSLIAEDYKVVIAADRARAVLESQAASGTLENGHAGR